MGTTQALCSSLPGGKKVHCCACLGTRLLVQGAGLGTMALLGRRVSRRRAAAKRGTCMLAA